MPRTHDSRTQRAWKFLARDVANYQSGSVRRSWAKFLQSHCTGSICHGTHSQIVDFAFEVVPELGALVFVIIFGVSFDALSKTASIPPKTIANLTKTSLLFWLQSINV